MRKLPKELKSLVHDVITIFGQEIKILYGQTTYKVVEQIRESMKRARGKDDLLLRKELTLCYRKLEKSSDEELTKLAHIYSLYLELINHCESTFRSQKLKQKKYPKYKKVPHNLIYVFTAHPTESRSENAQKILSHIEEALHKFATDKCNKNTHELAYYIRLLLLTSLSNTAKPTLIDEANHIYNIVLSNHMLEKQIELKEDGIAVRYRAWIGGDKDGHPFVDESTTQNSLSLSRKKISEFVQQELTEERTLIATINGFSETSELIKKLDETINLLKNIESVTTNDYTRVKEITIKLHHLHNEYQRIIKGQSLHINKIITLLELYPLFVMPLEFREDATIIHKALTDPNENIRKMIRFLKTLGEAHHIYGYVRGFIVSMTESVDDLRAALELQRLELTEIALPVVPLFEKRSALEKSAEIVSHFLDKKHLKEIKNLFDNRFEIMLGYSDSSKESGLIEGRWLIAKTLSTLDHLVTKRGLTPLFFHGSGGSIERGGGSVREQTQWWPTSALSNYKVTIQGEMVERNFSNPLIMEAHVQKIVENFSTRKSAARKVPAEKSIARFSEDVSKNYSDLLKDPQFLELIKHATPYPFLDSLKIGSRPTKRASLADEELKLRAIPWVLCWTQTRALLPTWYGIGMAWRDLDHGHKKAIINSFNESHFLRSFIKVLGFTLEKIEPEIFRLYVSKLSIDPKTELLFEDLMAEFKLVKKFFFDVSKKRDFLWYRPWLSESIEYRSAMIHPLNLIQIIAMKRENMDLLKESVSGIACGMMTTG